MLVTLCTALLRKAERLAPPTWGYPAAPMLLSRGDFGTFLNRPISASVLAAALIVLLWGLKPLLFKRKTT